MFNYKFITLKGGTILSQSGNPGDQGTLHGGGTIVQYSGQDGSLVSYVPGNSTVVGVKNF